MTDFQYTPSDQHWQPTSDPQYLAQPAPQYGGAPVYQPVTPYPVQPQSPYAPVPATDQPTFAPPSQFGPGAHSHRASGGGNRRKIAAVVAAVVVGAGVTVGLVLGLSGGDSKPTGYNDPDALAISVQEELNQKASDNGYDFTIDEVDCIGKSTRQFLCHVDFSDGDSSTLDVTVAPDGESWISDTH